MNLYSKKNKLLEPLIKLIPNAVSPNSLSIARLLLSVPLIILLLLGSLHASAVIFIFGIFLDFIDGPLARYRNQISRLGKFIDPLADKALFLAPFIILGFHDLPFEVFALVIIIETFSLLDAIVFTSATLLIYKKELTIEANRSGQYKMFLFSLGTVALFANAFVPIFIPLSASLFILGSITGVISIVARLIDSSKK